MKCNLRSLAATMASRDEQNNTLNARTHTRPHKLPQLVIAHHVVSAFQQDAADMAREAEIKREIKAAHSSARLCVCVCVYV